MQISWVFIVEADRNKQETSLLPLESPPYLLRK